MNRKSGFKPKTISGFNDFFKSLQAGDVFYVTSDYTGRNLTQYKISRKTKVSIRELEKQDDYGLSRWKNHHDFDQVNADFTYRIKYKSEESHYLHEALVISLDSYILYKSRPATEDT
jgi:hypothetical protein